MIVKFLAAHGPNRQFFPQYSAADFSPGSATFRGLHPADILLALRGEELAGLLAAWDQQGFRQTVVEGYSGPLRWLRPLYNGWARLRALPRLPGCGESLRCLTAALPIVGGSDAGNNIAVFARLINGLLEERAGEGFDYLLLGLHESDPLWPALRSYRARRFTTRLYIACWEEGEAARAALDNRTPYLELGCL